MRKYYLLIILVLTVCFAAFDMTNILLLGKYYTPFIFNGISSAQQSDETQGYAPYMQHFASRGETPYEVDVIEAQHKKNNYTYLYVYIIGFLLHCVEDGRYIWILAHTFFPVLSGVLLFYLISREVKNRQTATILVLIVCLAGFGIRNFLGFGTGAVIQPLELSRTLSPSMSFPHLLLVMIGFYRVLIQQKIGLETFLTGLLLGLLVYGYYFYWTVAFICIGVFFVFFTISKRWDILKPLSIILLIGILVGGQYFYNAFVNLITPQDFPLTNRFVAFSRVPYYLPLFCTILGIIVWKFVYQKQSKLEFLLYSILLSSFFCINLHVLTGVNAQHLHYLGRIIIPLSMVYSGVLGLSYMNRTLGKRQLTYFHLVVTVISIAVVFRGLHKQIVSANLLTPFADTRQALYDILDYTQRHFPLAQVIGTTQPYCIGITPTITRHWLFVPNAVRTNVTNEEIFYRYLIMAKIESKSWQNIQKELSAKFPSSYQNSASYLPYLLTLNRKPLLKENSLYADSVKKIYENIDITQELSHRQLNLIITDNADSIKINMPRNFQVKSLYKKEKWTLLQLMRN